YFLWAGITFVRWGLVQIRAWIVFGVWVFLQLFLATLHEAQGVAWWAHAGGFAFGVAAAIGARRLHVEERVHGGQLSDAGPPSADERELELVRGLVQREEWLDALRLLEHLRERR